VAYLIKHAEAVFLPAARCEDIRIRDGRYYRNGPPIAPASIA